MSSVLVEESVNDDENNCFPLSHLQQAYLFGTQHAFDLHVGTHTYFEFRLQKLDVAALEVALNRLIATHEVLRMKLVGDGQMHILDQVAPYTITVVDLTLGDAGQCQQHLAQVRARFEHADVDFYHWPYFAVQVSRMPGQIDHVHFNWSPMFIDGRSVSRLFHLLSVLYLKADAPCQEAPFSYADYARRREQGKSSPDYAKAKAYWWARLADLPHGPELPLAHGRQQPMRSNMRRRRVIIETEVWSALKAHAAKSKLGLTPLMMTLFAATIAHWSKSKHFTLTMLIQSRDRDVPGCEEALASFTSTVLVEMDFRQPRSLIEHVKILHKRLFLDFMHSKVCGLEVLQQRNREQHSLARANSPVAFVSNLEVLPGTEWSEDCFHRQGRYLVRSNLETPQIGLDHQVAETQNGELALNWDAMDELFYPGMADEMLATYRNLIVDCALKTEAWTEPLQIPIPSAQAAILQAANFTGCPYNKKLLHQLFQDQAAMRRDAPALLSSTTNFDYRQLQHQVIYWSRQLVQTGARPNTLIAVFMHKGWEQIVAALAITTAGAAYVPIDPSLPAHRIAYLLERCEIEFVLTQSVHAARAELHHLQRLVVDTPCEPTPQSSLPIATQNSSDQDRAYIIFTSGSTGQPKGVVLNHEGPVNTLLDINAKFGIGATDRVFAISALSFDLSVYDVFGLMAAGGAIVMPDFQHLRDPAHWLEMMQRHRVTVWNSAPALMQMLVEYCREIGSKLPASLRVVMLSGDWIPTWLPTAIHQDLPHAKIYSLGGATEASIWSIYYPIETVESAWLSIPYGKPLANQTMHVLDAELNPRPIGVAGDLYIGGIGLAQGYWKDTQTTQHSFIQHPHSGERLYRTGDLGRYLLDGNIEFLGREDAQIKLQGYRVELGEIETVLQQHAAVTHAVVIVHGDQAASRRLVAYVATGGRVLSKEALSAHAGNYLPPYMVPATYILLDKMPVTANGKVDRKSLPSPEPLAQTLEQSRAPQTATELKLAQIWQQVLNVPLAAIGAHISFFDLGGQSFLSVRMMAKIQQQFQIELPLAILIQADTIAALAEKIDAHSRDDLLGATAQAPSPLVLLREYGASTEPALYLIHPVGGNVLCYRGLVSELKTLPRKYYGLQSFGALQEGDAPYTLESIAARYIDAIQTVQPQGPYDLAGWSMGGVIAVEMARQLLAVGARVNRLLLLDAPAPMDQSMPDASVCIKWFFRDLHGTDALWMDDYMQDLDQQNKAIEWPEVLDHVLAHALVPEGTTREDLDAVFKMFLMNLRALRQYQPKCVQGVRHVLIARAEQPPIDELKHHPAANDPAWGWRDWMQQPIEICAIPGDHYSLFAPQHLPALLQKLVQWFECD